MARMQNNVAPQPINTFLPQCLDLVLEQAIMLSKPVSI
jgi:hypothetical protein